MLHIKRNMRKMNMIKGNGNYILNFKFSSNETKQIMKDIHLHKISLRYEFN